MDVTSNLAAESREWHNNMSPERLRSKFLEDFIKAKDSDSFCEFYNKISWIRNWQIPENVREDMKKFRDANENKETYSELQDDVISWFNLYELQNETIRLWWYELESKRKTLETIIRDHYEIPDVIALNKWIEELSWKKMDSAITNSSDMEKFLKSIYKNTLPNKKGSFDLMDSLSKLDNNGLNDRQLLAIESIRESWQDPEHVFAQMISAQFNIEQKKAIIRRYIPTISLQKLEELKISDPAKSDVIIRHYLSESLKKTWLSEQEIKDRIEELLVNIDKNSIILPSLSAISWSVRGQDLENAINKVIVDDWLESAFKRVRDIQEKNDSGLRSMDEKQFRQFLGNSDSWIDIKNIASIKPWDVLHWIILQEWQNDDWSQLKSHLFIQIENITDDWVVIKEITHPSWRWVINDTTSVKNKTLSFSDFIHILRTLDSSSELLDKATFELKKKNLEIAELATAKTIKSKIELANLLDLEDPEWKAHKLTAWTVFKFEQPSDEKKKSADAICVAMITKIDDTTVTIRSNREEVMTLSEFYSSFALNKSKRIAKFGNNKELLETFKQEWKLKWFKDLEWSDDKKSLIFWPQKENKDFPKVEYFVWKKWESIRLESVSGDVFTISEWEFDEKSDPPKYKQKTRWFKVTPEFLYVLINKKDLNPYVDTRHVKAMEAKGPNSMGQEHSVMQSLFSMQSVASLLAWWKQFVDNIKHSLKSNTDLQAAEFALMLWKTLPGWMQSEFQARVDWANSKKMKDKIAELENLWPWAVNEYIVKRLKIKNLPRYEIEALLIFIMKKHWCLYPNGLKEFAWSYFWFKRLLNLPQNYDVRNHALYKKMSSEKAKANQPIVEEDMLEEIIVELTKNKTMRSSFTWEFLWAYKEWMKWQKEGWLTECKDKYATMWWKIDFAVNKRLKNWRYMQALWAIEWILDKWWSAYETNYVPFLFLASWVMRTLDPVQAWGYMKWLWIKWAEPMLLFWSDTAKMDIFDRLLIKYSEEHSKKAWDAIKEIFKARKSWSKTQAEIIEDCEKFWKAYWSDIVWKFNTTDPEVVLKAQEEWWDYKAYISHSKVYLSNVQYKDDHLNNELILPWRELFMLWWNEYLRANLWSLWANRQLSEKKKKAVFDALIKGIDSVKKISNKAEQLKTYKYYNKEILIWLLENSNVSRNQMENSAWWSELLKRIWIPSDDMKHSVVKNIEWLSSWQYDNYIELYLKIFLSWATSIPSSHNSVQKNISVTTEDILNWKIARAPIPTPKNAQNTKKQKNKTKTTVINDEIELPESMTVEEFATKTWLPTATVINELSKQWQRAWKNDIYGYNTFEKIAENLWIKVVSEDEEEDGNNHED